MTFVSIITVCFNEVDKIQRTCDSLVSQSFRDFEWIVIDGGSTDGTVEVLDRYKDHMSYYISEKDKGIYNAMNKGIQKSKGEYLLFLNGGDFLYESATLEKVNFKHKNEASDPDLLYGEMVNEQTKDYMLYLKDKVIDINFFSNVFTLHHQATFIKAQLFKSLGLYDESYRIAADYEWWIRYFTKDDKPKNIFYLDEKIAFFDVMGTSLNPKNRKLLYSEVIKALTSNIKNNPNIKKSVVVRAYYTVYCKSIIDRTLLSLISFFDMLGIRKEMASLYKIIFKSAK